VAIIEEQRNVSRVVKTTLAISMCQRGSVIRPGYPRPVIGTS
jgi:hypothetical protein